VISDYLDREQDLEDIENDPDIKDDEIYNLKLSVSVIIYARITYTTTAFIDFYYCLLSICSI